MVLRLASREPLGAISEHSMANEARDYGQFGSAWAVREKRHFPLLAGVTVYQVRPPTPADAAGIGDALGRQLYGEFRAEFGALAVSSRDGPQPL